MPRLLEKQMDKLVDHGHFASHILAVLLFGLKICSKQTSFYKVNAKMAEAQKGRTHKRNGKLKNGRMAARPGKEDRARRGE